MENYIHPYAIIEGNVEFRGSGIYIAPFCILSGNIILYSNVKIGSHSVLKGNITIGENTEIGEGAIIGRSPEDVIVIGKDNVIEPYVEMKNWVEIGDGNTIGKGAVIGERPFDKKWNKEKTWVKIGDNNLIMENTIVEIAVGEGETTTIGNNNFIMAKVHIAHNNKIGNNTVIVDGVGFGGHVEVEDFAYISTNVAVHQFVRIGKLAMVGAYTTLRKDVPPFMKADGIPGRIVGLNTIGLIRQNISSEDRRIIEEAFRIIYRNGYLLKEALKILEEQYSTNPYVQHLVNFIKNSKRGILGLKPEE